MFYILTYSTSTANKKTWLNKGECTPYELMEYIIRSLILFDGIAAEKFNFTSNSNDLNTPTLDVYNCSSRNIFEDFVFSNIEHNKQIKTPKDFPMFLDDPLNMITLKFISPRVNIFASTTSITALRYLYSILKEEYSNAVDTNKE